MKDLDLRGAALKAAADRRAREEREAQARLAEQRGRWAGALVLRLTRDLQIPAPYVDASAIQFTPTDWPADGAPCAWMELDGLDLGVNNREELGLYVRCPGCKDLFRFGDVGPNAQTGETAAEVLGALLEKQEADPFICWGCQAAAEECPRCHGTPDGCVCGLPGGPADRHAEEEAQRCLHGRTVEVACLECRADELGAGA